MFPLERQKLREKRSGSYFYLYHRKSLEQRYYFRTLPEFHRNGTRCFRVVEAASHYYFGKSSADLTKSEAAWIAVCLPNPKKYDPKNPSSYLSRKHSWVMRQMNYVNLE